MLKSAVRRRSLLAQSDDVLAREAAAGGVEAFGELYRRHAAAAWGVAQAVVRNPDDASDAVAEAFTRVLKAIVGTGDDSDEALRFRPYLLTATRHAAIDLVRRRARVEASDGIEDRVALAADGHPVDHVVAREEQALVVEAFGRLPERWRTAMWLIDVEQLSTRDAAAVLGIQPNNAAQLAARGRARLREQFLQAHVPNHIRPVCRENVATLGSYLAGTASTTRRALVEDHIATCAECAERLAHVRDLGIILRRAILPMPLLLDRRVTRSVTGAVEAASSLVHTPTPVSVATVGGRVPLDTWSALVEHLSAASPAVERLVAGVTAAAFVVGVSTAAVKTQEGTQGGQDGAAISTRAQGGGATWLQAGSPGPAVVLTGPTGAVTGAAGAPSEAVAGGTLSPLRSSSANASQGASGVGRASQDRPPVSGDLVGPTLRGANLAGVDLGRAVVPRVDFTGANLSGGRMTGANLTGALLSGADLSRVDASGAVLRGSDLSRSALTGANLTGANLTGANLSGANLTQTLARGSNLTRADLTQTLARGADLTGADLSGAVIRSATLSGADLTRTVLAGADLRAADLTGAKLAGANLSGADLTGAKLAGADLTSAAVTGVKLADATLTGTVLTGTGLAGTGVPETGDLSTPASVLPGVAELPGSVPTTLPVPPLPAAPVAGLPLLPGADPSGTQTVLEPTGVLSEEASPPVAGPVSEWPGSSEPAPEAPGPQSPVVPVPAPLVGGPLLPGLGGILTNSPLSPVLG